MVEQIKHVAVLGASGTIGSLIGGLIAQQGIKVHYLSRTLEGAKTGLKKAIKQARSEVISRYIECWDYEHGLEPALKEADLIIESVSEDLHIKQQMYNLVERNRRPGTIVGTTTSSLPLSLLAEGRTDDFRRHLLSTHFYNPPGRMLACEVARTETTDSSVYDLMLSFLEHKLRRVVIPVRNIPAFAGNHIAFILFDRIAHLVEHYGVEMMDYLIGPYTGRLMPPLATLDLVGLDVHHAIINSLKENFVDCGIKLDDPNYIEDMISLGLLGNKTGKGFYKLLENDSFAFYDPNSQEYISGIQPRILFVEEAKQYIHLGMYKEAFDVIKNAKGTEANIVKDILAMYLYLAFSLIGEVTEEQFCISGIDQVMAFGFNWAPPSIVANLLGGREATKDILYEMGYKVPVGLDDEVLSSGQMLLDYGRYFIAK